MAQRGVHEAGMYTKYDDQKIEVVIGSYVYVSKDDLYVEWEELTDSQKLALIGTVNCVTEQLENVPQILRMRRGIDGADRKTQRDNEILED